jgi:hypothetical protein
MQTTASLLAILLTLATAGCSGPVSEAEARKTADEYARTHYSLDDRSIVNVEIAEEKEAWVVTYSAKGQAFGGPLIIGVNKYTGKPQSLGGAQYPEKPPFQSSNS